MLIDSKEENLYIINIQTSNNRLQNLYYKRGYRKYKQVNEKGYSTASIVRRTINKKLHHEYSQNNCFILEKRQPLSEFSIVDL